MKRISNGVCHGVCRECLRLDGPMVTFIHPNDYSSVPCTICEGCLRKSIAILDVASAWPNGAKDGDS